MLRISILFCLVALAACEVKFNWSHKNQYAFFDLIFFSSAELAEPEDDVGFEPIWSSFCVPATHWVWGCLCWMVRELNLLECLNYGDFKLKICQKTYMSCTSVFLSYSLKASNCTLWWKVPWTSICRSLWPLSGMKWNETHLNVIHICAAIELYFTGYDLWRCWVHCWGSVRSPRERCWHGLQWPHQAGGTWISEHNLQDIKNCKYCLQLQWPHQADKITLYVVKN